MDKKVTLPEFMKNCTEGKPILPARGHVHYMYIRISLCHPPGPHLQGLSSGNNHST